MTDMNDKELKKDRYMIRDFRGEDAETLSELIRRDIREVTYEDPEWEREYLYNFYVPENIKKNAETGHTYVIEDADTGKIVATGTIKKDSPAREGAENEAEICGCFIDADSLRKGIGSLLFDALENDPDFLSAARVWLTTSVYAREFYENRGYRYSFGYRGKNEDNLTEMEKIPAQKDD